MTRACARSSVPSTAARRAALLAFVPLALAIGWPSSLLAQDPCTEEDKVTASDGAAGDEFGHACSVSADTSATAMVMPAEGPSLGVAPSGMWMWMSTPSWKAGSSPSRSARDLA